MPTDEMSDNSTNYDKIFRQPVAASLQGQAGTGQFGTLLALDKSAGMQLLVDDVGTMMRGFGQATPDSLGIPDKDTVQLRHKLIHEEVYMELLPAIRHDDLVGIADGIADAIVVLIGCALSYGIPIATVWPLVHASNMAKIDPVTGQVNRRSDGKALKPEGWVPPTDLIRLALGLS